MSTLLERLNVAVAGGSPLCSEAAARIDALETEITLALEQLDAVHGEQLSHAIAGLKLRVEELEAEVSRLRDCLYRANENTNAAKRSQSKSERQLWDIVGQIAWTKPERLDDGITPCPTCARLIAIAAQARKEPQP